MDKIIIKDLEIFANHGVFEEEKKLGQKFVLDIILELNLKDASDTDDLNQSINYGQVCKDASSVLKDNTYDLIETVADKVSKYLLIKYKSIKKCSVTLKKPFAPIGMPLDYAAVNIERSKNEVCLSIGSNVGDTNKNLNEAICRLKDIEGIDIIKVSKFIKTKPWGYENQDDFLNGALYIHTIYDPSELMKILLFIEKEMKRERKVKWGPRIIDLDIIFFNDLVISDDFITIPHPRMEEREFVLRPLAEIVPNKVHPLLKKRVFRLLQEISNQ